jgi:hypothetical protein
MNNINSIKIKIEKNNKNQARVPTNNRHNLQNKNLVDIQDQK